MKRSDNFTNVMAAIGGLQAECLKITKDSTNPHFKSKYASLSAILDVVQPVLTKHKLAYTQMPEAGKVTTLLVHTESGEWLESEYDLNAIQQTPQAIGSSITYARRYSLTATLGLNIDDDDDGNAATSTPKVATPPKQAATPAPQQTPTTQQQQTAGAIYNDAASLSGALDKVKDAKDLGALYLSNRAMVDASTALQQAFKTRETQIKNGGKVIPTDKQLQAVCERIFNGDMKAYEGAKGSFILTELNIKSLDNAKEQFEARYSINYKEPADIALLIEKATNATQVLILHKNNAFLIDRDADLQTKINAKLRVLKTAA